jgi:hypothetical protein
MKPKLSDLTDPSAVTLALEEFGRLGRDEFLVRHGFGKSRDYLVQNPRTNELADSKAIAAAALKHQFPELRGLRATDFSGGEATVVPVLERLGFRVVRLGGDWSRREVELIVADYLSMLTRELTGQPYNKAEHRRQLIAQLDGRNESAVEFKHCNISAVMLEIGFPYLRGYKPRSNFQRSLLMEVVSEQVVRHRVIDEATLAAVNRPVESAEVIDFARVRADAPQREHVAREPAAVYAQPIKRDYLEREANNRSLGLAGEDFALRFERWRLLQAGAGQLADMVEHVSVTRGDGLGYDILSFEPSGRERFIEVKTTSFGQKTPFFISANEVRFARQKADQFRLYRLFDFRAAPRLFELDGEIEKHCALDPSTYRATFA